MKLRNAILYTNDIHVSKNFYLELGFEIQEDFGKFISFKTDDDGVTFAINLADEPTKVPGKQTIIFTVSNIREHFKLIQEMRITIHKELYKAPFGWTFSFRDPDGNKIEYVEMN